MTHEEYQTHARKLLELIPEAKAVAMDNSGKLFWYESIPSMGIAAFYFNSMVNFCGYLGKIQYDGDWKDTLVVRKWVPKKYDDYFVAQVLLYSLFDIANWDNSLTDNHRLTHNLVFQTKKEAIARAKELLGIKEE